MSRLRFMAAIVLSALFAGLIAAPAASARVAEAIELPTLVQSAKQSYANADFYGADAVLPGPISDPEGVIEWHLRFVSHEEGIESDFQLDYSAEGVYLRTEPWHRGLGIQVIEDFAMTQDSALRQLRSHGYAGGFSTLYLSQPLVPNSQPTYYFCMTKTHSLVGVGARTHAIFPLPYHCQ